MGKIYYKEDGIKLYKGDCINILDEIEEKSIGIESYLYYQNKDLKITNLGKCSKCEKKISESAPSYICYKCCQASKPKQFCIECITEENAYVKFENVDKIKEEVNQYNIYLNNLTTDDSPCGTGHLLIYFPPMDINL